MINDLLHWIESFTGDPVFYVVVFVIAMLDSVVPIVPGETTVILGGIAAGRGDLALWAVIAMGTLGAFVGDSTAYWLGRTAGSRIEPRIARNEKGAQRLEWVTRQLATRGGLLLLTARFIPGGRTMVTVASGLTHQPFARFAFFDLIASFLWATYAGTLGFFFGEQFADNHTLAFVLAFVTALAVSGVVELVRHFRNRGRQV